MNSDKHHSNHEKLEARLTALLLGELPADEAARLSQAIEHDPALAKLHERLKQTVVLVTEASASPREPALNGAEPLKLDEKRRQELLARFKTVKPNVFEKNRAEKRFTLVAMAAIAVVLAALSVMTFSFLSVTRSESGNVRATVPQQTARLAAEAALEQARRSIDSTLPADRRFGPVPGRSSNGTESTISLGALYHPRPPIQVVTSGTAAADGDKFRFYLDLNRNQQFNPNGWEQVTAGAGSQPSGGLKPAAPTESRVGGIVLPPNGEVASGHPAGATLSVVNQDGGFKIGDPEPVGILKRPSAVPTMPASGSHLSIVLPSSSEVASANTPGAPSVINQDGTDFLRNSGIGSATASDSAGSYAILADSFTTTINGKSGGFGGGGGGGGAGQPTVAGNLALNWDEAKRQKTADDSLGDVGGERALRRTEQLQRRNDFGLNPTQSAANPVAAVPPPVTPPLARTAPAIDPATGLPVGSGPTIDPATGLPLPVETPTPAAVGNEKLVAQKIKVDPNLFKDGLASVTGYSADDRQGRAESDPTTRVPRVSLAGSGGANPSSNSAVTRTNDMVRVQDEVRKFFTTMGVDLDANKGKSIFYNDREGTLTVRGTEKDLETIQTAVDVLNQSPPQVHVKAKFVELGQSNSNALGFDYYLGNTLAEGGRTGKQEVAKLDTGTTRENLFESKPISGEANGRGWNEPLHQMQGNSGLADGSVNQSSRARLQEALKNSGDVRKPAQPNIVLPSVASTDGDKLSRGDTPALDGKLSERLVLAAGSNSESYSRDKFYRLKSSLETEQSASEAADTNAKVPARELRGAIATNGALLAGKDWNFPTGSFSNIGWLGRVQSGTAWQTATIKDSSRTTNVFAGKPYPSGSYYGGGDYGSYAAIQPLSSPKTTPVEIMDPAQAGEPDKPTLGAKIRGFFSTETERKARIKVERDQSDLSSSGTQANAGYDPYFVQNEFETIQSDAVLGKVVKDLDLNRAWAKKGDGKPLDDSQAIALLKKKLDLRPVRNTSFVEIGAKGQNGEEAAKLANAVASAYKEHRAEQQKEVSFTGFSVAKEELAQNQQRMAEAQKEVDRLGRGFQNSNGPRTAAAPVGRGTLTNKLSQIQLNTLNYDGLPLNEVVKNLADQSKAHDPEGRGINFIINPTAPGATPATGSVEPTTGLPALASTTAIDTGAITIKSNLPRGNVRLVDALDAIVQASSVPLKYSIEDYGVVFSQANGVPAAKEPDLPPQRKPAADAPVPQPEVATVDNSFSTFSLNVSDVSFKLAAASLEQGAMPEANSVRTEEFINAFDYRDPEPSAGIPVAFAWERARYPFAQNRDLVRFSLKTAAAGRQPGKPMNIVLLMDNSGSMERADRVTIIREALKVLAAQLRPEDKFSIVTFSRTARLAVNGVAGNEAAQATETVGGLTPEGGTNLEEAMRLAYATALRHYQTNGINRVVLLTDGAANLGDVEPESLKQKVEANRKQGIALDCFGIGWEGYNDDLLEVLSRNGDGRYGFINTPEEAATEFVGKLAGALQVAASDVKVQVEFNPKRVTVYRQLGYAKHQLTKEQFRDNTVDAAELGVAEAGNALYVIEVNPAGTGALGTVRVRYKVPGTSDYREQEWALPYNGTAVALDQASAALKLAASASAFSEWLVASPYAGEVTPDALLSYLRGVPDVYGADGRPKKLEWMIRQAKSVAGH